MDHIDQDRPLKLLTIYFFFLFLLCPLKLLDNIIGVFVFLYVQRLLSRTILARNQCVFRHSNRPLFHGSTACLFSLVFNCHVDLLSEISPLSRIHHVYRSIISSKSLRRPDVVFSDHRHALSRLTPRTVETTRAA